jgi:ABC-type transport system substrate-binding protein
VRNPLYWRPGLPKADELVILIVPDASARLAALRSGRADIAFFDNLDAQRLLSAIPDVKVVVQSVDQVNSLWVNAKTPQAAALKDQRVRQALNLAIDRDQIIRTALAGFGKPTLGTLPGTVDECDASKLPKRDVSRAKALLAEAGATGLSFELMAITSDEANVRMAQVIQQNLAEAGMTARVQTLEQGAWLQRATATPAMFDTAITFSATSGDNWIGLSIWSTAENAFTKNFQLDNPVFDSLLDKTRALPPGSERGAQFQQMCGIIAETENIIPLTTRFQTVAYRSDRLTAKVGESELHANPIRFVSEFTRKE